jgi:NADH:ubiquinone oxidoreductase subunit 6 (subunit J)
MNGQGNLIGTIMGLFVSILLIWVFWQVISQLNIWLAVLFLITAILIIASTGLSILRR